MVTDLQWTDGCYGKYFELELELNELDSIVLNESSSSRARAKYRANELELELVIRLDNVIERARASSKFVQIELEPLLLGLGSTRITALVLRINVLQIPITWINYVGRYFLISLLNSFDCHFQIDGTKIIFFFKVKKNS